MGDTVPISTYVWEGEREIATGPSHRGVLVVLPPGHPGARCRILKPPGENGTLSLMPRDCNLDGGNNLVIIGSGNGYVDLVYDHQGWRHKVQL
jgi:hypothetical protein